MIEIENYVNSSNSLKNNEFIKETKDDLLKNKEILKKDNHSLKNEKILSDEETENDLSKKEKGLNKDNLSLKNEKILNDEKTEGEISKGENEFIKANHSLKHEETLNAEEIENELSKDEKTLNKDNPSNITLNINDFLEEQEVSVKKSSDDTIKIDNSVDTYEKEMKLKYPINDPDCPLYLRYMNILKHDYTNYSNSDIFDLYKYSHNNNVKIRRKDLLKIATVDGKFNYGIDF